MNTALARTLGIAFVFSWFFFGGLGHFVVEPFFTSIVPPYIPYPREVVYISGVLEILGAFGLLIPRLRRLAGACLFLLTLAVTPANIHMSLHPELFVHLAPAALASVFSLILAFRLVVQVFLLGVILFAIVLPARPQVVTA